MDVRSLNALSVSDPSKFDEIMTMLEGDMEKFAVDNNLDIEACRALADAMLSSSNSNGEINDNDGVQGMDVKLPGGSSLKNDGSRIFDTKPNSAEDGILITPKPVFSLKTSCTSRNHKVFVNVCVDVGGNVGEPREVSRLDDKGEAVKGLSVPVAVSSCRRGGKGGSRSLTFDCVVNQAVVDQINSDGTGGYRDFVCQLVMQYVEQKSGKPVEEGGLGEGSQLSLDRRYKLPKLLYHAWVDEAGKVVAGEDLRDPSENYKAGKYCVAKQWVRKLKKGERGIQEMGHGDDGGGGGSKPSNSPAAKASARTESSPIVPLKTTRITKGYVPVTLTVESDDGECRDFAEFAKEEGLEVEYYELGDGGKSGGKVMESQRLSRPVLNDKMEKDAFIRAEASIDRDAGRDVVVVSYFWLIFVLFYARVILFFTFSSFFRFLYYFFPLTPIPSPPIPPLFFHLNSSSGHVLIHANADSEKLLEN